MTKFRFHRGGLSESLETTIEVNSKKELLEKINEAWDFGPRIISIKTEKYAYDERIQWDTYIVLAEDETGFTMPAGFTDGDLSE